MIEFKGEHRDDSINFSSGPTQNEVLTIISDHKSSAYQSEINSQNKISSSDQSFWETGTRVHRVKGIKPLLLEKVFIRIKSKWSDYHNLWISIFYRSLWEKFPRQDLYSWSQFLETGRIIDVVQGITPWRLEKVFIKTHPKWISYNQLWTSILWRSLWEKIIRQNFSIWSKLWTNGRRIDIFQGRTTDGPKQVIIRTHWK